MVEVKENAISMSRLLRKSLLVVFLSLSSSCAQQSVGPIPVTPSKNKVAVPTDDSSIPDKRSGARDNANLTIEIDASKKTSSADSLVQLNAATISDETIAKIIGTAEQPSPHRCTVCHKKYVTSDWLKTENDLQLVLREISKGPNGEAPSMPLNADPVSDSDIALIKQWSLQKLAKIKNPRL